MTKATKMTATQGKYLAYISLYRRLHRKSPSEADMQGFFGVTPPTVHQMILQLERKGLIERTPGLARSIRLLVRDEELPELQESQSIDTSGMKN
jgi:DNA-binding MarR family transcriptional regulator